MEQEEYNTVEDFVFNKSFQEWVLNNDPYSTKFWLNWISYNPDKASLVNYSRAIVDSLPVNKREAPEDEINDLIEGIIYSNRNMTLPEGNLITPRAKARVLVISRRNWLTIVAIFIVVVASTWYLINRSSHRTNPYKSFAAEYSHDLNEITNHSDSLQRVTLPDGSIVLLETRGKLSYTSDFLPDKRVVYITGKAIFDIRKDASKPFIVYTESSIVKAMGTSFEISMSAKQTVVTVMKGNVLVRKRSDVNESSIRLTESIGTLVTSNQQLVLNESTGVMFKTVVKEPVPVTKLPAPLVFNRKPAAEVLITLFEGYGIPVVFDQEALSACKISADLSRLSFYEQLSLIANTLKGTYEIIDGSILINAPGCK